MRQIYSYCFKRFLSHTNEGNWHQGSGHRRCVTNAFYPIASSSLFIFSTRVFEATCHRLFMNMVPVSLSHEFRLRTHSELILYSEFFLINFYILIVPFKWAANPFFPLAFSFPPSLSFFPYNECVLSAAVPCVDSMSNSGDHRRLLCIALSYNRLSEGFGSLTWLLPASSN